MPIIIPIKSLLDEEDNDGVEYFMEELEDMVCQIDEAIDDWPTHKIANADFIELEFLLEGTVSAAEDV